jgi:hypothetical protein
MGFKHKTASWGSYGASGPDLFAGLYSSQSLRPSEKLKQRSYQGCFKNQNNKKLSSEGPYI